MHKSSTRYAQKDVQSKAEAKDHAESQSKAAVKTKVEGFAQGSEAVIGKGTFTIKEARDKEKGGKRETLKSRRKDTLTRKAWKLQGKAQCQAVQELTLDHY